MKKILAGFAILGLIALFTPRAEAVTLTIGQGGTGTSTAPTYGQLLLGNALGGYSLVSTSSLGILNGVLAISQGGTGISTAPTYGQLLLGNGSGGYTLVSTSSLGILGYSDAEARNAVLGLFPATTSPNVWSALQTLSGGLISTEALIGASATSSLANLEVIASTGKPSAYLSGSLLIATSSWFGEQINMDSVFSAYANGSFKERMVRVFCKYPTSISSVTSNTIGVCGNFSWNIDVSGTFRNALTTDTTNKMLWMRMAITTLALGNGGRLGESTGFSTNFAPFYYEATMRFPDANATNSIAIFGFTSNCASMDTSSEPANGLYFVASTTRANWIAVAGNTSVYTNVDTGFATTSTTATRKFTIVSTTTGTTMFAINNQWVANITSNNPSPSTQMCPNASISVSPTGVVPGVQNMDIGTIEAGWTYGIY